MVKQDVERSIRNDSFLSRKLKRFLQQDAAPDAEKMLPDAERQVRSRFAYRSVRQAYEMSGFHFENCQQAKRDIKDSAVGWSVQPLKDQWPPMTGAPSIFELAAHGPWSTGVTGT